MAGKTNKAKTANTFVRMECASCGTTNQNAFYMSKDAWHKHYGKICYCKECVKAIYSDYLEKYKDMNLAVYYTCRKIDVAYIHANYLGAVENVNNDNAKINGDSAIISAYMKGFAFAERNGWGTCFDESQGEDQIDKLAAFDAYTKIKKNKKTARGTLNEDDYENIEYSTEYLRNIWGDYDVDDLAFLQSEYLDWEAKLGGQIDEKSIDIIVKQICCTLLDINKERAQGNDVTKKTQTLMSLMNNAGLVEKQNKVTSTTLSAGQRIEDIEKMRPLKTVDPELNDIDHLRMLYDAYVGCMARTLGKPNAQTEDFDKLFAPYTIDIIGSMTGGVANDSTE